jgi:hypothetical protein
MTSKCLEHRHSGDKPKQLSPKREKPMVATEITPKRATPDDCSQYSRVGVHPPLSGIRAGTTDSPRGRQGTGRVTNQGFRHDQRSPRRTGNCHRRPRPSVLAVSEAIVSHRDLPARFYELAGLLHQVVRFDYLTLFLHDAARSAPRAAPARPGRRFPRGASRRFTSSSHSALSATQCRALPCEETPRRLPRRHDLCFGGSPGKRRKVCERCCE